MGYLIHFVSCAIEKKRAYSIGIFYILRKYIWYEGTSRHIERLRVRIRSIEFYQILSNIWAISEVQTWYIELYMMFEYMFGL